jgi:hypothetical protein
LRSLEPNSIDVLLVDGPSTDGDAGRSLALPLMEERLKNGAFVIADDTNRAVDADVITTWEQFYPELTVLRYPYFEAGAVMFRWTGRSR